MLTLVLASVLTVAFNVQQFGVKASLREESGQARSVDSVAGADSTNLTSSAPIGELSWTQGEPFPVVNGRVIFPPISPSISPSTIWPGYNCSWKAGSVYPQSLPAQDARSVYMSIMVPPYAPKPDEFYYAILSAWDSNGSYDQIGFSDTWGIWGLTYSWTTGAGSNIVYNFSPANITLSPGVTYTFNITTQGGSTLFNAYQGAATVWNLTAPTGGNFLILNYTYSQHLDYTDYEEIHYTSTDGGAPDFSFYFYNNYWTSTSGNTNAASWTNFYTYDHVNPANPAPSNVAVVISGNMVLVDNPGWPMFHHDLNHMGYYIPPAPNTNQTLWTYATGGGQYGGQSSPAVANGIVYVGSGDHNVYALNAATSAFVWSYTTDDGNPVESSPAVDGGFVYVGSIGGDVYALNATTGEQVWSYTTGTYGFVFSSPAVAGGVVYVGAYDKNVYALNATTGAFIWGFTTGGWVYSSPAVAGGLVYVGSEDGNVYALNATTGAFMWSFTTGGYVDSSPAVVGGVVYVGSTNGNVYALNAATSAFIWSFPTGSAVHSSPAVVGGVVYVGSTNGNVYALNAATGRPVWVFPTGSAVYSSPAVAGGVVYVGSNDDNVYALNAATGTRVWSYTTGGWVYSSPAVADGKVYVGSYDGKVYAFGVHDVVLETGTVVPSNTVVGKGFSTSINVIVADGGDYPETFSVTAYANATIIGSASVTLPADYSATVTFTWNTTGFAYGNYTMSAYAWPVPGETNMANNNCTGGTVEVTIPGDINGDGTVDIYDAIALSGAFNMSPGSPNWSPNADINGDGIVDIYDAIIMSAYFNQSLP